MTRPKTLNDGIHIPVVCFFDESDKVDAALYYKHIQNLIKAGVHGIVVSGTNGEAALLTREERKVLVETARKAVDDLKLDRYVAITVGVGGQSNAQVLEFIKDAKDAGGDFALCLPCSFFPVPAANPKLLIKFYEDIATASSLPLFVYNFPDVTGKVDIDSEVLTALAEHPNIYGCKLTDGNLGKFIRLTSLFSPEKFKVFGGSSDYLLPALQGKACGCVTGAGNIFPKPIVHMWDLWQEGKKAEAEDLQGIVANSEWATRKTGITGTKYGTGHFWGYPPTHCYPRKPYLPPTEDVQKWMLKTMDKLNQVNKSMT